MLVLLVLLVQTALVRTFAKMKTLTDRCGFNQLAQIHGTAGAVYDGVVANSAG